jgi:hypothetical protein
VDHSVNDVGGWIRENIDAELWPNAEIVWGKRVKWEPRV